MPQLPAEVQSTIIDMVVTNWNDRPARPPSDPSAPEGHPALKPPPSGACPLMSLPAELRRFIFAESLSQRDASFRALCDDKDNDLITRKKRNDQSRKVNKKEHTVANLMTLNRKVCHELCEVMYEERTFVLHVHEGLKTGGVEILSSGRQPLQYQDCVEDTRFAKFAVGDEFGFARMKKIVIQIFPTTEDHDRHLALNTHFMNLALCRLLSRPTNDKQRITSIKIEFVTRDTPATNRTTRAAIMRHEKPWMDANGPKQSSIHNVSDIELALRPFAILTRCHSASIDLPAYLADDIHLANFVTNLEQSMMSATGTLMPNDNLERQVEQLREELESHVRFVLHGNRGSTDISKLTDSEMAEDNPADFTELDGDEGVGLYGPVGARTRSKKHPRSPTSSVSGLSEAKRRGRTTTAPPGSSSLLADQELTKMDEDVQMELTLQLSKGVPRHQLGLNDEEDDFAISISLTTSTRSNASSSTKTNTMGNGYLGTMDEDDWQLDLAKQHSSGDISTATLMEMGMIDWDDVAREPARERLRAQHALSEWPALGANDESVGMYGARSTAPASPYTSSALLPVASTTPFASAPRSMDDIVRVDVSGPLQHPPSSNFGPMPGSSMPPNPTSHAAVTAHRPATIPFASQLYDSRASRTAMQTEDSGIGMLASDDSTMREQPPRSGMKISADEQMVDGDED